MEPVTFAPFEVLDHLRTAEDRAEFLLAAIEMDDEVYLDRARQKIREAEERYGAVSGSEQGDPGMDHA